MFISAQKNAPFYVMKLTNNFFFVFFLTFIFNCQYWCPVPSTISVVKVKSLKTQ